MDDETKKLRAALGVAERAVEANRARLADLKARREELVAAQSGRKRVSEAAEIELAEALDRFIVGEVRQEAIDAARERVSAAKRAADEQVELLAAADRGVSAARAAQPALDRALDYSRRVFWRAIAAELIGEIHDVATSLVERAYVATNASGAHCGTLTQFVGNIFPNLSRPDAERSKALERTLLAERE